MNGTKKNYPEKSTNVRVLNVRRRLVRSLMEPLDRLAPSLARSVVRRRFFRPRSPRLSPAARRRLDAARGFRMAVRGRAVQCWQWGSGPPVLCVHGWNGRGGHFGPLAEALQAAGLAAVTFDAPAHGRSSGRTTNYFEFTDVVRAFLTHCPPRAVVGHSLGGAAVVNAICKENADLPAVLLAPALRLGAILDAAFGHLGVPPPVYRGVIADLEALRGYDLSRDDPIRLLPGVPSPLLMIHDRGDRVIPHSHSRAAADACPQAALHSTRGLGHKRVLVDPAVIERTATYLRRRLSGELRRVG